MVRKQCFLISFFLLSFPGGSVVKNLPSTAGDWDLIPGSGRSPREGNGNSLQYSCLGSPMDRGAWWATGHGVAKNQTRLSNSITTHLYLAPDQKKKPHTHTQTKLFVRNAHHPFYKVILQAGIRSLIVRHKVLALACHTLAMCRTLQ